MPMDDAIALVVRNYGLYRDEHKKMLPPPKRTEFIPPSPATLYLFNLLADNQFLTVEEMDIVTEYIDDRRDRLIALDGGIPRKKKMAMQEKIMEELALAKQESLIRQNVREILRNDEMSNNTSSQQLAQQQQTFQQQIPQSQQAQYQPSLQQQYRQHQASSNDVSVGSILSNKSIDFDSPMVQSALDNLIASGPNFLKNISDTFEWNPTRKSD